VRGHSGAPASFGADCDALGDLVPGLDGVLSAIATPTTSAVASPAMPTANHTRRFRPLTGAAVIAERAVLCLPIRGTPVSPLPHAKPTQTIRVNRKTGMTTGRTDGDRAAAHASRAIRPIQVGPDRECPYGIGGSGTLPSPVTRPRRRNRHPLVA